MRAFLVGLWIAALIVASTLLIGVAGRQGWLIWGALPLTLLPILGLGRLRPREELAGWTVFTIWLGSTYLQLGSVEIVGGLVVLVLALLGFFRSPWFLVVAWYAHIPWDFVPRQLPEAMVDLPVACLIFDGLVGTWLVWRTRAGRWS